MSENSKIYDITFKRMFRLSGRMLIKFVNKVFEKNFPLDSEVRFLDPNSEDEENAILEKDIYFEICGERFQIEAQSYWDDMMFRLFEYAVSNPGDGYEKTDDCHAEYRMPKQAVVFLKGKNRKHDKLYIKLILPDDQEVVVFWSSFSPPLSWISKIVTGKELPGHAEVFRFTEDF